MIDANLLRENPEAIKVSQRARGASVELVDQAALADDNWRKAQAEFENLRAEQNAKAKLVAGDLAAAGRVQGAFEYVESASPISLEIELAPTSES